MAEGQQFPIFITACSDPNQRAFDEFVMNAERAGKRAGDALGRAMSGVKDTVAEALSIPRNSSGSLDLNISQLREMERQSEAVARATREYALASKQAAIATGENSRARTEEIRAAFELARVEAQNLSQLRAKLTVMEQVQAQLNQTASSTDQVVKATNRGTDAFGIHATSMRGSRQAMIQTGQQMQDMAIQFQMGTRASTILAQQVPQLAFALTSLEGSSNKTANRIGQIASLMSGPWSIAVVGLSAVIGGLIDAYILSGDSADKAKSKTLLMVDALSKEKFGTEEARKAIEDYVEAKDAERRSNEKSITEMLDSAKARLQETLQIREQIKAIYDLEMARAAASSRGAGGGTDPLVIARQRYETGIAANDAATELARKALNEISIQDAKRAAEESVDPIKRINRLYNDMADAAALAAVGNEKLTAALKGTLIGIEERRKVELDAAQASQRSGRADLADFSSPLRSYRTTGGFAEQRKDRLHAGLDMAAPMGTPVYAPQAGTISFAALAGAYGNLIKMNHGGGTETRFGHLSQFAVGKGQEVNKGDLLGYVGSTGRSTGAHLHYEVRVNGKPVDPTKGKFPFDASKVAEEGQKARDAAERAAEQMQRFAESSAEKVKRINEQFDEQPRLIDQANAATSELERTMADLEDQLVNNASLTDEQRASMAQTYKEAEAAKGTIEDALVRPYRQLAEDAQRRVEIERLLAQGREDEADALQIIWQYEQRNADLTEQQKTNILDMVRAERAVTEELRARQQVIGYYLDATRSVKQELVSIFSGNGSFGNLQSVFRNINAQVMVEQIFGPMFRDLDKWVKEQSGVTSSVDFFADETKRAGDSAKSVADAFNDAAQRIRNPGAAGSAGSGLDSLIGGIGGGVNRAAIKSGLFGAAFGGAANDNGLSRIIEELRTPDITVMGRSLKQSGTALGLDPERYFTEMQTRLAKPITQAIATLGVTLPPKLGGALSGAFAGNMIGGPLGAGLGLLDGLGIGGGNLLGTAMPGFQNAGLIQALAGSFGLNLNPVGSQLGGVIGMAIPGIGPILGPLLGGLAGGGSTGSLIGGGLGALGGLALGGVIAGGSAAAGGAMAGAALGPIGAIAGLIIGSLIGSLFKKAKYGNASFQNGALNVNTNSSGLNAGANSAGNDVLTTLNEIADSLGATLGSFNVSLGQTDGKWRISSTGRSGELKSGYSDVQVFGTGEEAYKAALAAAIKDAISDGAITGISQAAQNILKAGGDLQKAIEKAALIQSIPKRLKQMTDPVGYAIDELNAEFTKIVDALKLGSASAAEFADAQKLYDLKRAEAIKQASEQMTSALRGLLNDLTTGNDALSLRERQTSAVAKYDPLRARVEAGDATAFNDFADAARALLDIERQMFGSQSGYFDRLAEVTGISRAAVAGQDALISGASGAASPFAANDNVTSSIDSQTGVLVNGFTGLESQLAAVNQNLGALIAQGYGGAQSGYSFPTPYASYY
jgi:murein DD-endopeptidase MepM/ murein hydrolase activator NlpD